MVSKSIFEEVEFSNTFFAGYYDKEKYVELLERAFQNLEPVDLGLWRREHVVKNTLNLDAYFPS